MLSLVEPNSLLLSFVQTLIMQHFAIENYCTVIYHDQVKNPMQSEFQDALEQVFLADELPVIWIATGAGLESNHVEQAIEQGCQSYIIITKDVFRFFEIKLTLKDQTSQRMRDKFHLIFVENIPTLNNNLVIEEALNFYPNLWFMTTSNSIENGFDFYTQNFSTTESAKLYHVNSFDLETSSFTTDISLFHDKLFNLGGRNIRTGVVDYVAYLTADFVGANKGNADAYNSSLAKELRLDGLEGALIVEFCNQYNCNLKVIPFGADNWGYINENGTGEGMLYSPITKDTEIVLSTVYYVWIYKFLDYSSPTAYSSIMIMVPRAKLLPTFLTPLYPFNPTLWLTIFITLIVMTAVHHGITTLNLFGTKAAKPPVEKSIFDMISIYLDQGIIPNTKNSSYRVLISFILLSGVVLSNSYAGGLASVLTIPRYEKSLETIHDFADSPYRWGAPAIAWILSIMDAESVDLQTVVEKFDTIPDLESLYQRSLKGDFGIGIELLTSQEITVGPYIRADNVHLFEIPKQMLYHSHTTVASQRGWPIMGKLNKFILEAIQHGLVLYWEKRLLRKYQSTWMEVALDPVISKHQKEEVVQPLTVEHILGPIFILLVGTTLATGIFILEILWHSLCLCLKKREKNFIRSFE